MKQAQNKIFFLFLFLILSSGVYAEGLGAAVSPDKIYLDNPEAAFTIINPNDDSLEFTINTKNITCTPSQGQIRNHEKQTIRCASTYNFDGEEIIIIDIKKSDQTGNMGIIPSLAVKAFSDNDLHEKDEMTISTSEKSDKETVEKKLTEGIMVTEKKQTITPPVLTIILLTAAIITVITYRKIKNIPFFENNKKREIKKIEAKNKEVHRQSIRRTDIQLKEKTSL